MTSPRRAPAGAATLLLLLAPALAAGAEPPPSPPGPVDRFPRVATAYLVELDGRELWGRAPDAPLPPASLTKIMTALLALEGSWSPQALATVSRRAAAATGARLGLRAGERLRAGELLTAAMLASSNDACLALAEHLAGSETAFVARMNARAEALGLRATHFVNACGHDAPGHLSSARDLLRLTRRALALPEFRRLVGLTQATLTTEAGRVFRLRSTNALLGRLEGAHGVKTGFTPAAGQCVVALVERRGAELVVVLLHAAERWWAAAGLVEKAFEQAGPDG